MKTTLFLLLFVTFQAYCGNSYSQNAKVSIPDSQLRVGQILSQIESQTDYLFVYNKKSVDVRRTVNVDAKNKAVAELLDEIFAGTNIRYVMEGKNIVLTKRGESIENVAGTQQERVTVKGVVTDSKGVLKGLSWQGCPGVLFYNRDAAKEVLGTDDPDKVQEYVKDWDTYNDTAKKMKDAGYKMTASANDTYRVYSNNVTSKWVDGNKINIDDNIMKWVDDSKAQVDAGETGTCDLWSDDWSKGFYPQGKVFCYFGPAWLVNFSMAADTEGSIGYNGGWGAAQGPQGFFWGGTWICAAAGTDNANLVKDVMKTLCCDKATMKKITEDTQDYTNTTSGMNEIASSNFKSDFLGGQNHIKLFAKSAPKISMKNISSYDQGLNEEFQKAMKDYFDGNVTKDKALDNFYKAAIEKYPNLSK